MDSALSLLGNIGPEPFLFTLGLFLGGGGVVLWYRHHPPAPTVAPEPPILLLPQVEPLVVPPLEPSSIADNFLAWLPMLPTPTSVVLSLGVAAVSLGVMWLLPRALDFYWNTWKS